MLDDALRYLDAGLSVIPIDSRTKRPYWQLLPQICEPDEPDDERRCAGHGTWKPFQERAADEALVRWWFRRNGVSLGIVCGQVSGGLQVLDFDTAAAYPAWCAMVGDVAQQLPTVRTGKGFHVYWRTTTPQTFGVLARNAAHAKIAETKGEGGYVIAPPSIHADTGAPYEVVHGSLTTIPYYE